MCNISISSIIGLKYLGVVLLKERVVFPIVSMILGLVMLMLLAEGLLRAWYFVHHRLEPSFAYRTVDLGWRPTANLSFTYQRKGYGEIKFSSNCDGFRRFDQLGGDLPRILVVGDSFTQAYHVSDGKAYYDYLDSDLENSVEIFAFAAGGYGTVQQGLALEQLIPKILPDLIVWQFTGNDFINNDHWLETRSPENSSHMRRPFFEEGQVVHRHPDGFLGESAEYSLLLRRLLVIRGSYQKRHGGTIEDNLDADHPALKRSIMTTRQMVQRVKSQYANIPIVAFMAGRPYYHWELPAFAEVCTLDSLNCSLAVSESVATAIQDGIKVDGGDDGHWNTAGHKIAGLALAKEVQATLSAVE